MTYELDIGEVHPCDDYFGSKGANATTGTDVEWILQADSQDTASQQAIEQGIYVSEIRHYGLLPCVYWFFVATVVLSFTIGMASYWVSNANDPQHSRHPSTLAQLKQQYGLTQHSAIADLDYGRSIWITRSEDGQTYWMVVGWGGSPARGQNLMLLARHVQKRMNKGPTDDRATKSEAIDAIAKAFKQALDPNVSSFVGLGNGFISAEVHDAKDGRLIGIKTMNIVGSITEARRPQLKTMERISDSNLIGLLLR